MQTCQSCQSAFRPVQSNQIHCSKRCRDAAYRDRLREPGIKSDYHTIFVVNDTQYPYTDMAVWNAVCRVAADVDPDELVCAGDMIDFDCISRFPANPHVQLSVTQAVDGMHAQLLDPLIQAADPKVKMWLDGNHEERLDRYVREQLPALEDEVRLPVTLRINEWDGYVPYVAGRGYTPHPGLLITHGWKASKHSAYSAKAHVDETHMSVMHGHTHRLASYYKTTPAGTYAAYEMGHMTDVNRCPGFATGGVPNWQQTAGHIVRINSFTGHCHVEQTSIFGPEGDRRALVSGKEYQVD